LPFSFYFDTGRADRALQALITADDATAKEIAADFVAHECKQLADLVQGLKQPPASATENESEKAARLKDSLLWPILCGPSRWS
jgi:hypothetical protein